MTDEYFIAENGETKGPYSKSQIQRMWDSGLITSETQYWTEGEDDWYLVETLFDNEANKKPQKSSPPSLIGGQRTLAQEEQLEEESHGLRHVQSRAMAPLLLRMTPLVLSVFFIVGFIRGWFGGASLFVIAGVILCVLILAIIVSPSLREMYIQWSVRESGTKIASSANVGEEDRRKRPVQPVSIPRSGKSRWNSWPVATLLLLVLAFTPLGESVPLLKSVRGLVNGLLAALSSRGDGGGALEEMMRFYDTSDDVNHATVSRLDAERLAKALLQHDVASADDQFRSILVHGCQFGSYFSSALAMLGKSPSEQTQQEALRCCELMYADGYKNDAEILSHLRPPD